MDIYKILQLIFLGLICIAFIYVEIKRYFFARDFNKTYKRYKNKYPNYFKDYQSPHPFSKANKATTIDNRDI